MRSAENPYAGQGPVLLDVGGDVGALVVMTPPSMEGVEIEIRPQQPVPDPSPSHRDPDPDADSHPHSHEDLHPQSHADLHPHSHTHSESHSHDSGDHAHLTHVEVLPRPTPGGDVHCAVFPDLVEGGYELSERPFGRVRLQVSIHGGQITEAHWPPASP